MTKKLSTEAYKGTRDFYPEDMAMQKYIFSVMRKVAEKYGYSEYGASILEETALYQAKTGSEIVNEQTYSFIDRGERNVTIRPEMTPTVARMVAGKRRDLPFPLRWYSIPNLFRYERPQRGRLREHWQLNVDMFGSDTVEADAEIVSVAHDIIKTFGATEADFTIRLNNRKLITAITQGHFGLDAESAQKLMKLMDKLGKMETSAFEEAAKEIVGAKVPEFLKLLNARSVTDFPEELQKTDGARELTTLLELLSAKGITNASFDPSVIRGFDYYTGMVFEVFDTSPENTRSLFGGGRYDDLVSIFDVEKVSGVGFGMGDVTIHDYLKTHKLLPAITSSTDVYICPLESQVVPFADTLADFLRRNDVRVAVDYTGRKVPAQIKTAEKQGIPYIICVGEEEKQKNAFKVKNLEKREETTVIWDALPAFFKKN